METPSPPDLSPNEPPVGHDEQFFRHLQEKPTDLGDTSASAEGSVDSSGYEKVEHDVLEEYSNNFDKQMQQSVYGGLPDEPGEDDELEPDSGFLLVGRKSIRFAERPKDDDDVQLLHRDPTDLEATPKNMNPKDDVVEKDYGAFSGDLIDIPRNESPTSDKPLEPVHHDEPKHEEQPSHSTLVEDLLDFEDQAKTLVEDAVREAQKSQAEEFHPEPPVPEHVPEPVHEQVPEPVPEPVREPEPAPHVEDLPQLDEKPIVEDVHDKVDEILERMQENDEFQEMVSNERRSSPDRPDFRQTPEPEDTLFDRRGPLTIPEIPDVPSAEHSEPEIIDLPPPSHAHHGFETEPRPPTPPRSISEEDVKPSTVNLGHGHAPHSHGSIFKKRHSILKHTTPSEAWIDFKSVDPRPEFIPNMSKAGAVGRGLYALIAFLINSTFRVGVTVSLVASVCMTAYAVGRFSQAAIKERKEVLDLIYWRDPKKSGVALALTLIVVFVLAKYPLLSVLAYTGLAVLAATLGFRIFKAIEAQIKKTGGENPFQEYLNKELNLPQERVHAQVDVLAEHGTLLANQAKKLIFVENIVDSVKFGLLLWALTYISSWFSGFALIILTVLGIFSIPKVYETYQEPIDAHLQLISDNVNNVVQLLEDKLPFLKRAQAATEKKEQ